MQADEIGQPKVFMKEKRRGRLEWADGATCPKRRPGESWSLNADVRSLHLRQILRVSGKISGKISSLTDDRTSKESFVTQSYTHD